MQLISRHDLEIGEVDYGFDIDQLMGMDFLRAAGALIDLGTLTIDKDVVIVADQLTVMTLSS